MSSRTAAARKRLQDPRPKTSQSERSVNQAKSFAPASRVALTLSIPPSRNTNPTYIGTINEHATYHDRLDLSNEFSQPPPPLEYSHTYLPHPKSNDTIPGRIESGQTTPVSTYGSPSPYTYQSRYPLLRPIQDMTYQTPTPPPPPSNPRLQPLKRPSSAKATLSYTDKPLELPFLPSHPPPSPTSYPGYSALPPSSYSPRSNRDSTLTDLPEYRSTYNSRPGSLISQPSFQDTAVNDLNLTYGDNLYNSYHQYPSSSRSAAQLAALSLTRNENRPPYRIFPATQTSLNFPPAQSPIRNSHEFPGDSASFSGSVYSGTYSTSTIDSQPPAPPPSPNFVFPGSRSVARPKVSSKINLQLKIGTKSKLRPGKDRQGNSHPFDVSSQNSQVTFETSPQSPRIVLSNHPDAFPEESAAVLGDEKRKLESSAPKAPTETFVFPTSRSRAQPKTRPSKSVRNTPEGQSRFMGMFKKKIAKAPNLGPNGIVSEPRVQRQTSLEKHHSYSESQEQKKRIKSRSGSYLLDPYNSVLLDNDRYTGKLLSQLNSTGSPSFHDYGNMPPSSVLDLGCGQGYWVLEAAIAWKDYGTKVIGFDMVDISRHLLPRAIEKGVFDNIQFLRGNFLKQQLPFGNCTFDLVRMSCLGLCITSDAWSFVLQEVYRVLTTGGRLEFIDDQLLFPYLMNDPNFPSFDGDFVDNPSLRLTLDQQSLGGRHKDEAAYGHKSRTTTEPRSNTSPGLSPEDWNRGLTLSEGLETLFEHMLLDHFDIHKDPSDFILPIMKKVFGQSREVKTMHLVLAPPDSTDAPSGLSHCPGLILCPSTFIPMDRTEIENHVFKHLRTLMTCKKFLSEYAIEISGDERVDEDFVSEAIWEYENFLQHRFDPPVLLGDDSEERSETGSIRSSIAESAMWEIQSEFRQRYAWQPGKDPLSALDGQDNPSATPSPPHSVFAGGDDPYQGSLAASNASLEATHIRTFRVYEATKLKVDK